jgi:Flp pilus assembly protein CpaB
VLRTALPAVGVIAVIAAFVGLMYLRFANDTTDPPTATCCPGVVVAVRDTPAGTIIERDMVAVREMPGDKAEANAYHDTSPVIGQMAWSDIALDEQVVSSKISAIPPWGTGLAGIPARQPHLGLGFGY